MTMRPDKPASSVRRAKKLRRDLSLPEAMMWNILRTSPSGHKFRKQHPAGPYDLDFFHARANLAIEVDGISHDMGDRPQRDASRDAYLKQHRIDTLRIPASDILKDVSEAINAVLATVEERMVRFGKAPPSVLRTATSPSQVDGENERNIP
jgi:very-short-patch-repair endonuclease